MCMVIGFMTDGKDAESRHLFYIFFTFTVTICFLCFYGRYRHDIAVKSTAFRGAGDTAPCQMRQKYDRFE